MSEKSEKISEGIKLDEVKKELEKTAETVENKEEEEIVIQFASIRKTAEANFEQRSLYVSR